MDTATAGGTVHSVPELVCFDLPCLVVPRPGTAEEALDRSLRRLGVEPGTAQHRQLFGRAMGWPGIEALAELREVFVSDVWAEAAAAAFDDAFGAAAARHGAAVADGAAAVVSQLRAAGAKVCLTTEFSAATREAVLDVLDWPDLVAMLLSEERAAESAPTAVIMAALDRAGVDRSSAVVVSSSCSGVAAGRDAGVPCVVGIAGSAATGRQLRAAGASELSSLPRLASRWASARLVPA
jgi:beta-phosphoglucomutase-like phosphatase (HAD superfamily)